MNKLGGEKRRSLGRGLSALLPPKMGIIESNDAAGLMEIPIEQILPGDGQPRQVFDDSRLDELASSIRTHGVIQPIIVRKRSADQYEIVAGERRWRAAQRAGLQKIPVVVSDTTSQDSLTLALVENLQREDLNPIEEAEAFQRLHAQLGYTQQEIADAVGKDRTTIANALRLLKLPIGVRQKVLDGALTMGHARALLAFEDEGEIERVSNEVIEKKWSVRQTEKAAQPSTNKNKENGKQKPMPSVEADADREVRQRIQRALGTRVDFEHVDGRGSFTVHFASFAELDALLARISA